jgi:hypothetical protein
VDEDRYNHSAAVLVFMSCCSSDRSVADGLMHLNTGE